jgi:hypothetical protein
VLHVVDENDESVVLLQTPEDAEGCSIVVVSFPRGDCDLEGSFACITDKTGTEGIDSFIVLYSKSYNMRE